MDLGIRGKVAFVCASSTGLGRATARALAAEGVSVAFTGRRESVVADAERAAKDYGVPTIGLQVDLLDADARAAAIGVAQEALGAIDILVLNGPGPRPGGSLSIEPHEVVDAARTMIEPHVDIVRRLLPGMRDRRWGRIIAVGSRSMDKGSQWLSLSAIGRSGLARYLQALAGEVAADGVTVNIVQPGIIATERIDALDEAEAAKVGGNAADARARRIATMPSGRLGEPEEFASAVAFFASERAGYITGQSLMVDGGLYAAD